MALRFLADLNISPKTVASLVEQGIDIVRIDKRTARDDQVVALAKKEKRVIITFDKDFGEIYYFHEAGLMSAIILAFDDQRAEYVSEILLKFLQAANQNLVSGNCIILYDDRYRIIRRH